MERSTVGGIDYRAILKVAAESRQGVVKFLSEELPFVWRDSYASMTPHPVNVVRFRYGSFEYIFDDYASLESRGIVPYAPEIEGRLIAVSGCSTPKTTNRDDYRLKGWIGPTEKTFGRSWDKGHYIAHTIGGIVDGLEANVFVQRRDLNRGWSAQGKRYREMEKYCFSNPQTFCFSRPLYTDQTAKPTFIEFGVLKEGDELWIDCFDNR